MVRLNYFQPNVTFPYYTNYYTKWLAYYTLFIIFFFIYSIQTFFIVILNFTYYVRVWIKLIIL